MVNAPVVTLRRRKMEFPLSATYTFPADTRKPVGRFNMEFTARALLE